MIEPSRPPWPRSDGLVTLRPPRDGEEEELIAGRDAEWERWLGPGTDQPRPTAVIVVEEQIVGWVDYDPDLDWLEAGDVNLGYNVFATFRRHGYATRAVRLLLGFLADNTDYRRANLLVEVNNVPSHGVAHSLGADLVQSISDDTGQLRNLRYVLPIDFVDESG
jgi:RimJ/RimL family protein N-acetyltransferase